jgi:hypothetical protein
MGRGWHDANSKKQPGLDATELLEGARTAGGRECMRKNSLMKKEFLRGSFSGAERETPTADNPASGTESGGGRYDAPERAFRAHSGSFSCSHVSAASSFALGQTASHIAIAISTTTSKAYSSLCL